MKKNHTSRSPKLVALMAGAALFGLISQSAMAAVSLAGSTIGNIATLQYTVANVAQNSISSSPTGNTIANATPTTIGAVDALGNVTAGNGVSTNFLVDYKVNVLVSGGTVKNVTPGQPAATNVVGTPGAYTVFTVQNLSNATQDFALTAADAATGTVTTALALKSTAATDAFNSTGLVIYLDTNSNGVLDTGDTAIPAINLPAFGLAGATRTVFVASAIPVTATNGQSSVVSLQAQAVWPAVLPTWAPAATANGNTLAVAGGVIVATSASTPNNAGSTVDIVFADTVAGVVDAARDGKDSAYNTYTVVSAVISVAKTGGVFCDPVNGGYATNVNPLNIPASLQQYAITIKNTGAVGSAPANLGTSTDTLSAQLSVAGVAIVGGVTAAPATTAAACVSSGAANNTSFAYVIGTTAATGYAVPVNAVGAPTGAVVPAGGATVGIAAGISTVTINYNLLLPAGGARITAGDLMPGESITVFFNALVQ